MDKEISYKSSVEQGLFGVLNTGLPIFIINWMGGPLIMAAKAGLFQSMLTFCTVFVNTILFQHFFIRNQLKMAVLIPASLTTTLSFLLHSYIGSPEPFFSALFVLISALFFFSSLAYITKNTGTISISGICKFYYKKIKKWH